MNDTLGMVIEKHLGEVITVTDVDNYVSSYQEDTPFKAVFYEMTDYPCCLVRSEFTGKEFELYYFQIKEFVKYE